MDSGFLCSDTAMFCLNKGKSHVVYILSYIRTLVLIILHCVNFTEVDECQSNPCISSLTCNDFLDGYTCSCLPGYTGVHCETGRVWLNLTFSLQLMINNVFSQEFDV